MNLIKFREQAKTHLLAYVMNRPEKQYYGYSLQARESIEHFNQLSKEVGKHYGWVYVVWTDAKNQCKIGYTECNPIERVKRVFRYCEGKQVYVAAFPSLYNRPWSVERYVQNILYSCGLHSQLGSMDGIDAYSGGTEIFNIIPSAACALVDEAINDLRFTE